MPTALHSLTLFILRHGQAADFANTDFDRSLTKHGQQQASAKGLILQQKTPVIDNILCSAALRTQETLQYLNLDTTNSEIIIENDLYLTDCETLLNHIHQIHYGKTILIIGHNPGLHQFAYDLLSHPSLDKPEQKGELSKSFPTCALAELRFPCQDWSEIRWKQGTLVSYYK